MSDTKPIIAVDLDDVLSQTNLRVAQWHNERFDSDMDLSMFHYFHYWKNPMWGTPEQTAEKMKEFYDTQLMSPVPIPGALQAVQALRNMGYKLVVITTRHATHADYSQKWLDQHFPGIFDSLTCTGRFEESVHGDGTRVHVNTSKAVVCENVGARLLVDDSLQNVLECAQVHPRIPTLLFGHYEWNQRQSELDRPEDYMSYDERLRHENGRQWWKDAIVKLPEGVTRVKDWDEVVRMLSHASEGWNGVRVLVVRESTHKDGFNTICELVVFVGYWPPKISAPNQRPRHPPSESERTIRHQIRTPKLICAVGEVAANRLIVGLRGGTLISRASTAQMTKERR